MDICIRGITIYLATNTAQLCECLHRAPGALDSDSSTGRMSPEPSLSAPRALEAWPRNQTRRLDLHVCGGEERVRALGSGSTKNTTAARGKHLATPRRRPLAAPQSEGGSTDIALAVSKLSGVHSCFYHLLLTDFTKTVCSYAGRCPARCDCPWGATHGQLVQPAGSAARLVPGSR